MNGDNDSDSDGEDRYAGFWPIEKDEDVINTFEKAQEYFQTHNLDDDAIEK